MDSAAPATRAALPGRWELLWILGAATATAPLATHAFAPALPAIGADFNAPLSATQLTMSVPQLALAPALLAYGAMADAWGRRSAFFCGMACATIGALICLLAANLGMVIAGRVLLVVGAASGFVVSRAIIADAYERHDQVSSALAHLTMIVVLAPSIAPALGALLEAQFGWRSIFLALLGFGAAATAWFALRIQETRTRATPGAAGGGLALQLTRNAHFMAYAMQGAFSFALFLAFIATAPHIVVAMGGSPATYAAWFAFIALAYAIGNFCSAAMARTFGAVRVVLLCSLASLVIVGVMWALMMAGAWTPASLFAPMAVLVFTNGLANPQAQAGALVAAGEARGSASGLLGFLQMGMAALGMQAAAMVAPDASVALLSVMAAAAAAAFLSVLPLARAPRLQP